ncbi:MAG: hypothetical protein MJE77_25410 [Proteobacteria bacterium]|nr:hypothetical protein [Pseudomonadota bacterium]
MARFPSILDGFDVKLLPNQRIQWPERPWTEDIPLRYGPGTTHLIELRHSPGRKSLVGDPIHEPLVVETAPQTEQSVQRRGSKRLS